MRWRELVPLLALTVAAGMVFTTLELGASAGGANPFSLKVGHARHHAIGVDGARRAATSDRALAVSFTNTSFDVAKFLANERTRSPAVHNSSARFFPSPFSDEDLLSAYHDAPNDGIRGLFRFVGSKNWPLAADLDDVQRIIATVVDSVPGAKNFSWYLLGGVISGWPTRDADIVLCGPVDSVSELGDLIFETLRIAALVESGEFRFDMQHAELQNRSGHCPWNDVAAAVAAWDDKAADCERVDVVKHSRSCEKMGNPPNCIQLVERLCKHPVQLPSKKMMKKMRNGGLYAMPVKLWPLDLRERARLRQHRAILASFADPAFAYREATFALPGMMYVPGWLHGLRHESWPRHDAADEATRLVLTKLELQMKHDMALSRRWTAPMFRAALKLAFRYYAAAMLATAAAVLVCCCGLVIANRVRSLLGAAGVGAVSDDGTTQ